MKLEYKVETIKDNVNPQNLAATVAGWGAGGWDCVSTVKAGRYTMFVLKREVADPKPSAKAASPVLFSNKNSPA